MLQFKTKFKDVKTQKLQGFILKAVGEVTDTLINLKKLQKSKS